MFTSVAHSKKMADMIDQVETFAQTRGHAFPTESEWHVWTYEDSDRSVQIQTLRGSS